MSTPNRQKRLNNTLAIRLMDNTYLFDNTVTSNKGLTLSYRVYDACVTQELSDIIKNDISINGFLSAAGVYASEDEIDAMSKFIAEDYLTQDYKLLN